MFQHSRMDICHISQTHLVSYIFNNYFLNKTLNYVTEYNSFLMERKTMERKTL